MCAYAKSRQLLAPRPLVGISLDTASLLMAGARSMKAT
jgi:hypothetical protein